MAIRGGPAAIMGRIMPPRTVLSPGDRAFLVEARRAVLATIAPDGRPRLVPVCFVVDPEQPVLYTPLDDKPKRVDDVRDPRPRPRHPRAARGHAAGRPVGRGLVAPRVASARRNGRAHRTRARSRGRARRRDRRVAGEVPAVRRPSPRGEPARSASRSRSSRAGASTTASGRGRPPRPAGAGNGSSSSPGGSRRR